ncbi:MAG: hypothetical protein ACHQJ6_08035 [Candidatus Berkiellales bacterium]
MSRKLDDEIGRRGHNVNNEYALYQNEISNELDQNIIHPQVSRLLQGEKELLNKAMSITENKIEKDK